MAPSSRKPVRLRGAQLTRKRIHCGYQHLRSVRSRVHANVDGTRQSAQQGRSRRRGAQDRPRRVRQCSSRARHAAVDAPDSDPHGSSEGLCEPSCGPGSAEVGRRREDVRRLACACRENDRALEDVQARAIRGRREARDRNQIPERDVQLHGQGLPADFRDPQFLFPLHDRLRNPSPQRRSHRQRRLPRQPLKNEPAPPMEYRNLGRTGVKVSSLCLGTMMFGRSANEQESISIVHAALERGINFVDTANAYSAGASERFVGTALQGGRRASVVLATKAFFPQEQNDPNARGLSRRHLIEACEASLKRLQTDWIDLYQVHRSQSEIPIDETLRALDDLIRQGKVRYIGTSMFPAWKSVEALWASKELGLNRFVAEQMAYNLLDRTAEREVIPAAQTFGLALIPWAPLCGGLLTGKYKRDDQSAAGRWQGGKDNFGRPATAAAYDVIEGQIGRAHV